MIDIFRDIFTHGLEFFGLYYSKYRAFVQDNKDPDGWARLRLTIPNVTGDQTLNYWAWPASNFAGKNYGVHVIPKQNSLVWVEFEFGNPRRPIWSYGHFKEGDISDDLKDVNNYWFKTPGGNFIEFNDTNNTIKIFNIDGSIQLMDGSHGSLIIIQLLIDKLNDVENKINEIKNNYISHVHPANVTPITPPPIIDNLTITQISDIENDKITHGN